LNENLRDKAGLIYNVVESVILAMSVGMMVWLASTVIVQGNLLQRVAVRQENALGRLDTLEVRGSPALMAHEKEDQSRVDDIKIRVDKLEAAVLILQATPGELKAISVSLGTLHESQRRIEERLDKVQK
jgi:hypothetical protein